MSRTVVGLDLGSSAVRAVEVRHRGRTPRVHKRGRVPLPDGAVVGGQVQEPEQVTAALKQLWREHRFSTTSVRLGIGSGSVLVRQVELDWMPAADLRKAMRYLVSDLLPVPVDEANIDHVLLGEVERPAADAALAATGATRRMAQVLLVATAREGVDQAVRCVQTAGLRPVTADLSPLALVRAAARELASRDDLDASVTEAVLDIGADKIAVAVHSGGRPRFIRVVPGIGGAALTRAVAEALGTATPEAEAGKRASRLAADGRYTDPAAYAVHQAARTVLGEVRDTVSFFVASEPEHAPTQVALTGLGGSVPGFAAVCAQTLGMPVRTLDTSLRRKPGARDPADGDLAVSVGLCLGAPA